MTEKTRIFLIISFFSALQLILSVTAALRLSPVWDEIGYPISGAVQWRTGSLAFYPHNPYLGRLFFGLPLLREAGHFSPASKDAPPPDAARAGYDVFFQSSPPRSHLVFLTRIPSIVFGLALGILVFLTAASSGGVVSGVLAWATLLSVPILVSRFSLALTEGPMMAFLAGALFFHRKHRPGWSGVFWGLSVLCKFTALPVAAALLLDTVFDRTRPDRMRSTALFLAAGLATGLGGFLVWGHGGDSLRLCLHYAFHYTELIPFFWGGAHYDRLTPLISWLALAVKAPLAVWLLFVVSVGVLWRTGRLTSVRPCLLLTAVYLAIPLMSSNPMSTIQFSPLYLGVALVVGTAGSGWNELPRVLKTVFAVGLMLALVDGLHVHPNQISYFNALAGGPQSGFRWLADSDQDWGQSLPQLADALEKKPRGLTVLAYSGAAQPEHYGITYLDLISPALASRTHVNPDLAAYDPNGPVYIMVGTKLFQIMPEAFEWLRLNRKPEILAGGTMFLYTISRDREAFSWLQNLYGELKRPKEEAWFRAAAIVLQSPEK